MFEVRTCWNWLLVNSFLIELRISNFELRELVGLGGLEPPTSRLSGVRSSQLSYNPKVSQN
jgi:hypothetical protein